MEFELEGWWRCFGAKEVVAMISTIVQMLSKEQRERRSSLWVEEGESSLSLCAVLLGLWLLCY